MTHVRFARLRAGLGHPSIVVIWNSGCGALGIFQKTEPAVARVCLVLLLDDQLAFHAQVTESTQYVASESELARFVRQETDGHGLTFEKFRSNPELLEFESVFTIGRDDVKLDDLTLLDVHLGRLEVELASGHLERDIGRSIRGGPGQEPRVLDAAARHQRATCDHRNEIH